MSHKLLYGLRNCGAANNSAVHVLFLPIVVIWDKVDCTCCNQQRLLQRRLIYIWGELYI